VLIDTGPLVAFANHRDSAHQSVGSFLAPVKGQLLTTWPVLTECCHLLPRRLILPFMRWTAGGGVLLYDMPPPAIAELTTLMDKYADRPMDLADASLVWLADLTGVHDILTLDATDFAIYRLSNGRRLRSILRS
jgi:predicted nucleic acid-binding protein